MKNVSSKIDKTLFEKMKSKLPKGSNISKFIRNAIKARIEDDEWNEGLVKMDSFLDDTYEKLNKENEELKGKLERINGNYQIEISTIQDAYNQRLKDFNLLASANEILRDKNISLQAENNECGNILESSTNTIKHLKSQIKSYETGSLVSIIVAFVFGGAVGAFFNVLF